MCSSLILLLTINHYLLLFAKAYSLYNTMYLFTKCFCLMIDCHKTVFFASISFVSRNIYQENFPPNVYITSKQETWQFYDNNKTKSNWKLEKLLENQTLNDRKWRKENLQNWDKQFDSHLMFNLLDGPHQTFNNANVMATMPLFEQTLDFDVHKIENK